MEVDSKEVTDALHFYQSFGEVELSERGDSKFARSYVKARELVSKELEEAHAAFLRKNPGIQDRGPGIYVAQHAASAAEIWIVDAIKSLKDAQDLPPSKRAALLGNALGTILATLDHGFASMEIKEYMKIDGADDTIFREVRTVLATFEAKLLEFKPSSLHTFFREQIMEIIKKKLSKNQTVLLLEIVKFFPKEGGATPF